MLIYKLILLYPIKEGDKPLLEGRQLRQTSGSGLNNGEEPHKASKRSRTSPPKLKEGHEKYPLEDSAAVRTLARPL